MARSRRPPALIRRPLHQGEPRKSRVSTEVGFGAAISKWPGQALYSPRNAKILWLLALMMFKKIETIQKLVVGLILRYSLYKYMAWLTNSESYVTRYSFKVTTRCKASSSMKPWKQRPDHFPVPPRWYHSQRGGRRGCYGEIRSCINVLYKIK